MRAVVLAVLLLASQVHALNTPALHDRVNDTAGLLSEQQQGELEAKLKGIEDSTGHQFAFLSVPSLNGASIEEFAVATAHAWKLGDAKRDDGLLFVISKGDRKMRLEVGYGLEGMIPDAAAVRIVRDVAEPHLKAGDYPGGITAVFDACLEATKAEKAATVAEQPKAKPAKAGDAGWLWVWLVGVFSAGIGWVVWTAKREADEERLREQREREEHEARMTRIRRTRNSEDDEVRRAEFLRGSQMYDSGRRTRSPSTAYVPVPTRTTVEPEPVRYSRVEKDVSMSSPSIFSSDDRDSSPSWGGGGSDDSGFSGGGGDFGGGGASGDF